jgi:magnesium-transporting ATPase (P-type)
MAKKKRRIIEEAEEEYEFIPTEFNEREFILKEMYSTRIFGVAMVLAVIVGIVGAILIKWNPMENDGWYLMSIVATAISFAVMFLIKKISSLLGLHPELIDIKSLAGTYLIYLALALGVCILGVQF